MPTSRAAPVILPQTERRGRLRHAVEVEGVLSTAGVGKQPVLLTDISDHGCRIVRPAGLASDTVLSLSFGGFAPFQAVVVWTTAKAAGLRFEQPVHAALIAQVVAAAKGRKRAKRLLAPDLVRREERERVWHLALPVAIRAETAEDGEANDLHGILSDLTIDGCRVVSAVALLPGTAVLVTIDRDWPVAAVVRWSESDTVGLGFTTPLSPTAVRRIAELAQAALMGENQGLRCS